MNKIKEELRQKLQGQLSDEKTLVDVNVAYDVVEKVAVSFAIFCAENYSNIYFSDKKWFCNKTGKDLTTEEIFKIWSDEV